MRGLKKARRVRYRARSDARNISSLSRPKALLPFIQGRLPTLKRARRRIAEANIRDPEDFIAHSISELAAEARVSPGSIVMFCKSLGLKGLPTLKMALARELSEPFFVPRNQMKTTTPERAPCRKCLGSIFARFRKHSASIQT